MAKPKGNTVNLALVGCGGIAGAHLRGYKELLEKGKTGQVVKVNDVIKGRVNAYQKDIDRMWKL